MQALQKAGTDLLKAMIRDTSQEVERMGVAADTKQKEIAALEAYLQHMSGPVQDVPSLKGSPGNSASLGTAFILAC